MLALLKTVFQERTPGAQYKFLRYVGLGITSIAFSALVWLHLHARTKALKNTNVPVDLATHHEPEQECVECLDASLQTLPKCKTKKGKRDDGGTKRSSKTDEEKAQERIRKQQEAAIKLQGKHARALALREKLRDRFSDASPVTPIVLVALDLEAWEQDIEKVTEIGLAVAKLEFFDPSDIHPCDSQIKFGHQHILIHEHLELRNSRYVEGNKDNFLFGESEVMHLADAATHVTAELASADFIVGHALSGDLAMLRKLGVTGIEGTSSSFEDHVIDTQTLAFCIHAVDTQPKLGLRSLAEAYALDPQRLHNGGNDAAFTLQIMLAQCGVCFSAPNRMVSKHKATPEFQAAWIEASQRLSDLQKKYFKREEELQSQVALFADQIKSSQNNDRNIIESDEAHWQETLLYRFPHDLTGMERKIVHEAAEALGLQSRSKQDGPNGERCITIYRDALPSDGKSDLCLSERSANHHRRWRRRPGKAKKHGVNS